MLTNNEIRYIMYLKITKSNIKVVIKMEENEEMKEVFNNLTEENKEVLTMVAKGMEIAQNQKGSE